MRLPQLLVLVSVLSVGARSARAQARAGQSPAAPAPTPPDDPAQRRALLFAPTRPFWSTPAPDTVRVAIETSQGPITVVLRRAWAPHGVDRVYNLARAGYFDDSRFYRVVDGFIAQFGLAGDPALARLWSRQTLPADVRRASNTRGTISFAQSTPDDRTATLFINLRDNPHLDALGFAPIGRVVRGMGVADRLDARYGERPAAKANATRLYGESNTYLDASYPTLDRIRTVTIRSH